MAESLSRHRRSRRRRRSGSASGAPRSSATSAQRAYVAEPAGAERALDPGLPQPRHGRLAQRRRTTSIDDELRVAPARTQLRQHAATRSMRSGAPACRSTPAAARTTSRSRMARHPQRRRLLGHRAAQPTTRPRSSAAARRAGRPVLPPVVRHARQRRHGTAALISAARSQSSWRASPTSESSAAGRGRAADAGASWISFAARMPDSSAPWIHAWYSDVCSPAKWMRPSGARSTPGAASAARARTARTRRAPTDRRTSPGPRRPRTRCVIEGWIWATSSSACSIMRLGVHGAPAQRVLAPRVRREQRAALLVGIAERRVADAPDRAGR